MTNIHQRRCDSPESQRRGKSLVRCKRNAPRSSRNASRMMHNHPECSGKMHSSKENRLSRNHAQGEDKKGAQDFNKQNYDSQDTDSISATLSTVSSLDESSCCKGNGDECFIASGSIDISEQCDPRGAKGEDGYDTDNAVVNRGTIGVCLAKKDASVSRNRHSRPLGQQVRRKAHQIVEQVIQEQNIAIEGWDEVATEYHRRIEPFTSLFIPHLLDPNFVTPSSNNEDSYLSGKNMLDVGAGTGGGALYAASKGASSVTATDFSNGMLQVLRSRIDSTPCPNLETQIANGMCLPLRWTNEFDVVFSNFGVIYFPKVKEGLLEMVRCTKPGGKVCVSAWGPNEETHAFAVFPEAIKRCGFDRTWRMAQSAARKHLLSQGGEIVPSSSRREHRRRDRERHHGICLAPNYFCPVKRIASSQYRLRSMMEDVGLGEIQMIPVTNRLCLDAESYWDRFVLASPNMKRFIEHCLSPQDAVQLKDTVCEIVQEETSIHCEGGEMALNASAYIAIGTKSSARKYAGRKDVK